MPYRYTPTHPGEHIHGIPARDLTDAEMQAIPKEKQKVARKLYQPMTEPAPEPAQTDVDHAPEEDDHGQTI